MSYKDGRTFSTRVQEPTESEDAQEHRIVAQVEQAMHDRGHVAQNSDLGRALWRRGREGPSARGPSRAPLLKAAGVRDLDQKAKHRMVRICTFRMVARWRTVRSGSDRGPAEIPPDRVLFHRVPGLAFGSAASTW